MAGGMATSQDAFLDGRVQALQPVTGYRASTDSVFLAAAVPAQAGDTVLDLGCGTGVASLCLGWRVPGLEILGLEVQPAYAALARENARSNGISISVTTGDVGAMPAELVARSFDHVMSNPPYYEAGTVSSPSDTGKNIAVSEGLKLADWIAGGARRLKPGGYMTIVHRAARLSGVLAALKGIAGDIRVLPIAARDGRPASRVLVRARKGAKSPDRVLPPLIVHRGREHAGDRESHTPDALRVLREGREINL